MRRENIARSVITFPLLLFLPLAFIPFITFSCSLPPPPPLLPSLLALSLPHATSLSPTIIIFLIHLPHHSLAFSSFLSLPLFSLVASTQATQQAQGPTGSLLAESVHNSIAMFVKRLHEVNSNGGSIATDPVVLSLYQNLTAMQPQLLKLIDDVQQQKCPYTIILSIMLQT